MLRSELVPWRLLLLMLVYRLLRVGLSSWGAAVPPRIVRATRLLSLRVCTKVARPPSVDVVLLAHLLRVDGGRGSEGDGRRER